MGPFYKSLTTTTSLLEDLKDPTNKETWKKFDRHYRQIITSYARRFGLESNDAADVAQESLARFFRDYQAGKYIRDKGRLRIWMLAIATHRIHEVRREKKLSPLDSRALRLTAESIGASAGERPDRQAMLQSAISEFMSKTRMNHANLEIFRLHFLEKMPAEEVAAKLRVSERMVYLAKHRCLAAVKKILAERSSRG